MTIEQWLTAQKASMDPALQASAPPLQWFTVAVDDEEAKAKARAADGWCYIQYIQGDEVPLTSSHDGEAIYNCPSYFNIFRSINSGNTPATREVELWFDVLSSLPSFYREWGIDKVGQTQSASLHKIQKARATNRRPRKVQQGLLMATVYVNILISRA